MRTPNLRWKPGKIRLGTLSLDEVIPNIADKPQGLDRSPGHGKDRLVKKVKHNFNGYEVKVNSLRMVMFKLKGIKCSMCGLEGQFFALEQHSEGTTPHLGLYGVSDGKDILLTRDHIIPLSAGGSDSMENSQCLCSVCNQAKASAVPTGLPGVQTQADKLRLLAEFQEGAGKLQLRIIGNRKQYNKVFTCADTSVPKIVLSGLLKINYTFSLEDRVKEISSERLS